MPIINSITSRWVLDSRGLPTVTCTVTLDNQGRKSVGVASVPSGASTGTHEALELRDNADAFHGKGVSKAVAHINTTIAEALVGHEFQSALEIDEAVLKLDTSANKSQLGANAILGVSMAAHRAFADHFGLELWQYLRRVYFSTLPATTQFPLLMCNVLNGGAHADNGLSIQEFMIIPDTGEFEADVRIASEVYHTLKKNLAKDGFSTSLGDEGGFAPNLTSKSSSEVSPTKAALNYLTTAIENSTYSEHCSLGMDVASTEFYNSKTQLYTLDGQELTHQELSTVYEELCDEYNLISIEDGFSEDDIDGWKTNTEALGKQISLIGDDLFVTNPARFKELGLGHGLGNGVLIKLNQIGSVSETCQMINDAKSNKYVTAVSHRSGETTDAFISDLAFASQSEFIKLGAPARGERVAKYNRLLEIYDSLK
jgi:enolase